MAVTESEEREEVCSVNIEISYQEDPKASEEVYSNKRLKEVIYDIFAFDKPDVELDTLTVESEFIEKDVEE